MKFTEGYWEKNELANASYAVQNFSVQQIPGGMRVVMPFHPVPDRAAALDVGTITTEFTFPARDVIRVTSRHFQGYESHSPRLPLTEAPQPVTFTETDRAATLSSGRMCVEVCKDRFLIRFLADGKLLTQIGSKNLGYMQYGRTPATKYPRANYMHSEYTPYMLTELSLAPGECVYGLGERFTSFVKNGQTVDIWNEDGGTSSQVAYKNIPFYITDRHYGVFVNHTGPVSFEVASEKVECVGFSVPGEELEYHILYGDDMKQVLMRYCDLTGKPALPPAWSFGLWLSTSFTTDYDEKTVTSFIDGMKQRDIPLRVFHFDCFWMKEFHWCDFQWDERIFPDVEAMLRRYRDLGLKICVWINPYIAQGTECFAQARANGYLLQRADGRGVRQLDNWQPGMGIVDFTNPDAVRWYQQQLKRLLDLGVDCFKTDFGERIPTDVVYQDGSDPWAMHNYYTFLYNRAVFQLLEAEKGPGEAVLFARSAFAGSQQFPVHWGGDSSATYASMAETLRGGLSFALSGFSFWSHDIGGFEMTADADVYKRWLQFGLLSSHSRLHGSKSYRVPWLFDEESVEVCRTFAKLKNRLMPYLYSAAVQAHETGVPVLRPMVLEFGTDPAVRYLDMQYMLGDSLLVAPVFSADGQVDYYLPAGRWTHLLSGVCREGGRWYREQYDFMSLPLFVRENTLLPFGSREDVPDYDYCDGLQLQLYKPVENGRAECRVADTQGREVLYACAETRAGVVTLTMEGETRDVSILLRNIRQVTCMEQVAGCEVTPQGLLLRPQGKTVTITL